MMHNEDGEVVDWKNTTSMIWSGQRETLQDCLYNKCTTTFQLSNSEQFFYFANWDTNKNQTITFTVIENGGKILATALLGIIASVIVLF
mgnify:CR=1 FL=1